LLEKIRVELASPSGESNELAERGLNLYDILASIAVPEKKEAQVKNDLSLQQHSQQVPSSVSVLDKPFLSRDTEPSSSTTTSN
jgi:hypothetical protein